MSRSPRRVVVALAGAACALTIGLSGCSSGTGATESVAAVEVPGSQTQGTHTPVRVGVAEFAEVIATPGVTIVDVRTPEEFAQGHIEGAINIPVESTDFIDQVSRLDPSGTYAVYCRSGNRSQPAVAGMASAGIGEIYELESGTTGWTAEGRSLVQ